MPSLSERLKALGVTRGAQDIPPPKKLDVYPINRVIDGEIVETVFGETFVSELVYPSEHSHGVYPLRFTASMRRLAMWIGEPSLVQIDPTAYIFLDTETSGLAGGTGTYVFLVGIGRFKSDSFHLTQCFLREPIEERAHLLAVLSSLSDFEAMVTYNGKAFDAPLLNTRFALNGEVPPLNSGVHIDLLPLARRLWRDRLASRRLGYVENGILSVSRTEEDIPGWMIPTLYFDYLRSGDARPLKQVFYHNAMDILSLAVLLNHISEMLDNPHSEAVKFGVELVAIGRMFEDLGHYDEAAQCYAEGLEDELPLPVRSEARQRWSLMEKRRKNLPVSIELWQEAASNQEIYAFVELAKIYEHHLRDMETAILWTESAITLVQTVLEGYERNFWFSELNHRLIRLKRKAG